MEATSRNGQDPSLVWKTVVGKPTEKCGAAGSVAWMPSVSGIGGVGYALDQWGGLLGATLAPPLVGPEGEGGGTGGILATGDPLGPQPIPSSKALGEEGRDMGATLWPLLTHPGEEGRDMGAAPWPLLTPSQVGLGEEGRDMGVTLWPLLTPPGEEGRDMGVPPWPLLTPHESRPSPLEGTPARGLLPGLCVGPVRRARRS